MVEVICKKITKSGSITLPRQIRQELGLLPGVAVEISGTEDGGLVMRKHTSSCHLCGSADDVMTYKGLTLCRECRTAFEREVD